MDRLDPLSCALFLVSAFVLAGLAQIAWLASRGAAAFRIPIDAGRTFRGQRILGDNKTWAGIVAMVPATGLSFLVLAVALPTDWRERLWPLSSLEYGALGCWLGLGFMAGELPNSFLKRQLGVRPGAAPLHPIGRPLCLVVDRIDSILGALVALEIVLPAGLAVWLGTLLVAPAIHGCFSILLYQLGVKARRA